MAQLWSTPIKIQAMSLSLPANDKHPNRMPFKGVLTRIDRRSDNAPHGTAGRNIIVTRAAGERALSSLLGMGIGVAAGMAGHNAQNKIGIITQADIDGDAITIEGFIYAADFPIEALNIHRRQADLGFSFEASEILVMDAAADPVTITSMVFTGAAILHRNGAAYTSTSIAASTAKPLPPVDVPRELGRRLAAAGITVCDDGDRLSIKQLDRLLEDCHTTAARIGLKRLTAAVGLYPRYLT